MVPGFKFCILFPTLCWSNSPHSTNMNFVHKSKGHQFEPISRRKHFQKTTDIYHYDTLSIQNPKCFRLKSYHLHFLHNFRFRREIVKNKIVIFKFCVNSCLISLPRSWKMFKSNEFTYEKWKLQCR